MESAISTCPVCTGALSEDDGACGSCPVSAKCQMLCCRSCGFRTVAPRSAIVEFFRRLFGRGGKDHGAR